MPMTRPELPTYRSHPNVEACSTATRAFSIRIAGVTSPIFSLIGVLPPAVRAPPDGGHRAYHAVGPRSDLVWGLASRAGATSAREPKPASSHVQTARYRGLVSTAASLNPSSRSPRRTASASP